jgi:hypothetical protein
MNNSYRRRFKNQASIIGKHDPIAPIHRSPPPRPWRQKERRPRDHRLHRHLPNAPGWSARCFYSSPPGNPCFPVTSRDWLARRAPPNVRLIAHLVVLHPVIPWRCGLSNVGILHVRELGSPILSMCGIPTLVRLHICPLTRLRLPRRQPRLRILRHRPRLRMRPRLRPRLRLW